ncbi:hypothetical protein BN1708_000338 [Verticillium longisporum]|uniref:Large ribosomal subunit protein bL32m n=1 Tax=Verticillium longisporum TaxID=100787 RepID=A0A0G4KD12_VERLO|nr:hypothetical protein BN1708_000338 [Verticillium longisporum]
MASIAASTTTSLLPRFSAAAMLSSSRTWTMFAQQVTQPGIWEGILRAVPKKKTTHSKKRSRLMAGKALQDVTSICKCPGCGQPKRKHVVCPHCMEQIKGMWRGANPSGKFL